MAKRAQPGLHSLKKKNKKTGATLFFFVYKHWESKTLVTAPGHTAYSSSALVQTKMEENDIDLATLRGILSKPV